MEKAKRRMKRIAVGVAGTIVLIVGVIAIPYPGPGWLIVFTGLAILATEFAWAQRVLDIAKAKYDQWQAWLSRQPVFIKAAVWILTAIVVILTIWLLNGYGFINEWLNFGLDWLNSPLF